MADVFRIVTDSSADGYETTLPYISVPLTIYAGEKVYVDDETTDGAAMAHEMKSVKIRTTTACPSPDAFLEAYQGAQQVICVTITSSLSGSNNAANVAAKEYMAANPGTQVYVVDSLTAGAEMALICAEAERLYLAGVPFDELCRQLEEYRKKSATLFVLQSVHNLAVNGRVSTAVAALVGMLGIRILGKGSEEGTIEMVSKHRGDRKAIAAVLEAMQKRGYEGGKVLIDHCANLPAAQMLKDLIKNAWPAAAVMIRKTGALCSFYAEEGGLIIGYECVRAAV